MLLKMKKYWKNERGFTLIEILAVIVIIGLLSAVAVPAVTSHIANARVKAEEESMLIVKNAVKRYLLDNPITELDATSCATEITSGKYIDEMPTGITCRVNGTTGLIRITSNNNLNVGDITGY